MKDQSFVVKVADLINQPGKKDELSFEKRFSNQLPNLDQNGLSGNVLLQSLDKNSILVSLTDVKGTLEDSCDICQKSYKRDVLSESYDAKFILPEYDKDDDDGLEELFPIDSKTDTLNLEDMVVQSITLQEPIVRRCDDCQLKVLDDGDNDVDEIAEDEISYFEGKGNVIFK